MPQKSGSVIPQDRIRRDAELTVPERWLAGCVGLVFLAAAVILTVSPPGRRVALSQCPTAEAGCIVIIDQDLTTFTAVLAGLGALALLIALLGRRFSTLKVAGNELSHAPDTTGLSKAPPATLSEGDPPKPVPEPRGDANAMPIEVLIKRGLGTTTGTAPIAVARLLSDMSGINPSLLRDYRSARKESQRGYFLTHSLGPARHPGQLYSVAIRVTGHKDAVHAVKSARFFMGRSWGNRVFQASRGSDGRFGITTESYGPFVTLCDVEFEDGEHLLLDHYCDFDMGELVRDLRD